MTEYNYIKHNALMKKIIKKTLIILTWLIIWQLLALSVNIYFIFPGTFGCNAGCLWDL